MTRLTLRRSAAAALAASLLAALQALPAWAAGDYPLPPPPDSHVTFSAEQMDYNESSGVIHLKGKVLLKETTWTVRTDEIWLHTERRAAVSEGYIFLDDGYGAIHGTKGEFDLQTHQGWIENPRTGYGDWNVQAKSLRVGKNRTLNYRGARFGGCNVKPKPHYDLYSGHLRVVPKKYLLALNTVFFIGPIPVFYLPVFYAPMRDFHLWSSKLQFGFDRRNGAFVKSMFETRHSPYVYSKVFVDGYSSQGVGYGMELHRRKSQDSRGGLYGYHVREQTTAGDDRWTVVADQFQVITSSIYAQARLHVQSDAEFNNDYAHSKLFRITPETVNSVALVYQLPRLSSRLSYSRTDVDNGTRRLYVKQSESIPRLDLASSQLRFWKLPWINNLSGFVDNSYERDRGFQQVAVGARWEATRSFRLGRGVSLAPKVSYGQTYFDRYESLTSFSSTDTYHDVWVGRYRGEANVRYDTFVGDWDATYAYQVRQKPSTLTDDAGAVDHGIETNMIQLRDTFRPVRKIMARLYSGYDFRVFRNRYRGFRERVQPIVAEVGYTPTQRVDFTLRNDFQLADGNRSLLVSGFYGEPGREFISLTVGHNQATARFTHVNVEFGFEPSTATWGWGVRGNLKGEVLSKGGVGGLYDARLFEKEFGIHKKLHDFHLRAMTRFRPNGVWEFAFRAEMRFPGTKKEEIAKRDWEAEWFPERQYGLEDRP